MKIHELITKETWMKNSTARDSIGNSVNVRNPKAVSFCVFGWLTKVYNEGDPFLSARLKLLCSIYNSGSINIGYWNDISTFEEVKSALIKADI